MKPKKVVVMGVLVITGMMCAYLSNRFNQKTTSTTSTGESRLGKPIRNDIALPPAWEQFLQRKKELQEKGQSFKNDPRRSFHLPQPHYSKPDSIVLHSDWVDQLRLILQNLPRKQISMVTSSKEHQDVLVNWIAAAMLTAIPPLEDILVLSLDEVLHQFLVKHKIHSLYVHPEMVINPLVKVDRVFSQVHIVRLAVLRLINYYGFDVVNYDCDAVVFKNPEPLFEKYRDIDIIGTFGKGPSLLFTKWGITLNTGVLLLRSNSRVEKFWDSMNSLKHFTTDDQGSVNLALDSLNIKWTNLNPQDNIDNVHYDIFGIGKYKLTVVLLSFDVICRHTCNPANRDQYYVWHALAIKENRTVENKIEQARIGNAWLLQSQWQGRGENLTGLEWLKAIVLL